MLEEPSLLNWVYNSRAPLVARDLWRDRQYCLREPSVGLMQCVSVRWIKPCYAVTGPGLARTACSMVVKQVTTLPWHFTPKGALFGPIYGIYVG